MRKITYAAPCARPDFIPKGRPRGTKAQGLAYERALARALPKASHGQWFHYVDQLGPGWCQTDLLLESKNKIVIIEAKLTNYDEALVKLMDLYIPVVRVAYPEKDVHAVIALRHVTNVPRDREIFDRLDAALVESADAVTPPVFHWLGKGPVWG